VTGAAQRLGCAAVGTVKLVWAYLVPGSTGRGAPRVPPTELVSGSVRWVGCNVLGWLRDAHRSFPPRAMLHAARVVLVACSTIAA
jgi:hypothetical protein